MAIFGAVCLFFIIELVTRNPNLGIPALEDGLFANSLTFDYLYYIFLGREKGKKGRKQGKGETGREKSRTTNKT